MPGDCGGRVVLSGELDLREGLRKWRRVEVIAEGWDRSDEQVASKSLLQAVRVRARVEER